MPDIATEFPIATTTLSSATATVTFSSIPNTYTDLVLIITGKNPNAAYEIYGQFNSDTGTNYSNTNMLNNSGTTTSGRITNSTTMRFGFSNNDNNSNAIVQIMNYANTTTNKTALSRINNPSYQTIAAINLWRSTAAITSINLTMELAANFSIGSTFTLYGIL